MRRSGPAFGPFWNGFERHGRDARPIDFESGLIAAGHPVSDFVLLTGHHRFAALGRSKNSG
jgi:hypothetical protein